MKHRRIINETPVIDSNYLNNIYQNLSTTLQDLDKLNRQYKVKQQNHFLKTFMNIIEKIGTELLLAQQAYKNVDIQAKRDDYYLELAEQLAFFKKQSYNLKQMLVATQQELKKNKLDKQAFENQLEYTKGLYHKKMTENFELKSQNKKLKNKIKAIVNSIELKDAQFGNISKQTKITDDLGKQRGGSLTHRLDRTSPDFGFHRNNANRSQNTNKGDSMTIETAIPSSRKRNSLTLSPMANSMKKNMKSTDQSFNTRSIRTKKTSQNYRRILPEEYNPQTNM